MKNKGELSQGTIEAMKKKFDEYLSEPGVDAIIIGVSSGDKLNSSVVGNGYGQLAMASRLICSMVNDFREMRGYSREDAFNKVMTDVKTLVEAFDSEDKAKKLYSIVTAVFGEGKQEADEN